MVFIDSCGTRFHNNFNGSNGSKGSKVSIGHSYSLALYCKFCRKWHSICQCLKEPETGMKYRISAFIASISVSYCLRVTNRTTNYRSHRMNDFICFFIVWLENQSLGRKSSNSCSQSTESECAANRCRPLFVTLRQSTADLHIILKPLIAKYFD